MTDQKPVPVSVQLAALPSLPMTELWELWDQHFPRGTSHRNRNYVESRLAYRIQELAGELLPGTIGAKLQEWEQQEVEA